MDPIGKAIIDYVNTKKPEDIIVSSDICEDDIIPVEVLFRTFEEMPLIEQKALQLAKGKVLDVGSGAGFHALYLMDLGFEVETIDISKQAINYQKSKGINAKWLDFYKLTDEKYDTIFMLMNGLGISGTLSNLEHTLLHAKSLLNPGGSLLCDSSDIKELYEDEDGALWMDLNTEYYGNFRFQMKYGKEIGPWFNWLYVDFDNLFKAAKNVGLKAVRVIEQENHFLAKISYE